MNKKYYYCGKNVARVHTYIATSNIVVYKYCLF